MDVDPAALRALRAVADTGSLTGAARELGSSQPALSQQVRRWERRLGTALLERAGRGVRLTEAGLVLAHHGGTVTAALDAAVAEVSALAGLRAGRVRLLAFPSSSASIVPRALADLRRRHPGVTVRFSEAEPPESLTSLREGRCDIAVAFSYPGTDLGRGVDDLAGLVTRHLVDDPLWLALPDGDPLAEDDAPVPLAALQGRTWIAGCPRCRGHLLAECERAGFCPQVAYATDDYVAVLGLVAAGLGVALLPGLVVDTVSHPDVRIRTVDPATARAVHAVTTSDLLRVPAVAATVEALAAAAAGTSAG